MSDQLNKSVLVISGLTLAILLAWQPASAETGTGVDTGVTGQTSGIAISGEEPATAQADAGIAIGNDALADGQGSIAIGSTFIGPFVNNAAFANGKGAIAIGANASAEGDGVVAVGFGAHAVVDSTAVGNVAYAFGIGSSAFGYNAIGFSDYSSAFGALAHARGEYSFAAGYGAFSGAPFGPSIGATAIGALAGAEGNYTTSLGFQAYAYDTAENSVAIGAFSFADMPNVVSFGSFGSERRLTNVADPVAGTDAVNLRTLNTRLATLSSSPEPGPAGPVGADGETGAIGPAGVDGTDGATGAIGADGVGGVTQDQLNTAIASVPQGVTAAELHATESRLDSRIDAVKRTSYGGVALAMAMTQAVIFESGKSNAMAAGIGFYGGEAALGLSYNRRVLATGNAIVSAGLGVTTGRTVGAKAGVSWSF